MCSTLLRGIGAASRSDISVGGIANVEMDMQVGRKARSCHVEDIGKGENVDLRPISEFLAESNESLLLLTLS